MKTFSIDLGEDVTAVVSGGVQRADGSTEEFDSFDQFPEDVKKAVIETLKAEVAERFGKCERCEEDRRELRPYGGKGEKICSLCALQNPSESYATIRALEGPENAEAFMQFLKTVQDKLPPTDLNKMN